MGWLVEDGRRLPGSANTGGAEGDTFFGQEGADVFVIAGGTNWIMDFELGIDRIEVPGMDDAGFRAAASQVGDHLHVAFEGGDPGLTPAGAGLYLAWTTPAALEGVDPACVAPAPTVPVGARSRADRGVSCGRSESHRTRRISGRSALAAQEGRAQPPPSADRGRAPETRRSLQG